MDKFQNKYRIPSNRKPGWDYSGDGLYFITLVTQNRVCNLGEIVMQISDVEPHGPFVEPHGRAALRKNAIMQLSDFGNIVNDEWLKSFELRTELFCDEYIIMPNHLHAILHLIKPTDTLVNDKSINDLEIPDSVLEAHGRASLRDKMLNRKPKSISSFVGGFKSAINTKIDDYIDQHQLDIPKYNRKNHFFQSNYNDRIIRNMDEYWRIKNYIINNPSNWKDDTLNS